MHSRRGSFRIALVTALLTQLLQGCPRTPEAPEPLVGEPCEALNDCNPGVTCGALRLCVGGYCEERASLLRPCRDEGVPVVPGP
jgi:hypothetical protein